MSSLADTAAMFRELPRSLGAAGRARYLPLASIKPSVRVIACDTSDTRIIEVEGKRYRARRFTDDGVECWGWGAPDEIREDER